MVLKFIEWYFTVGGFAALLAAAVDLFAGIYASWLIREGKISIANDEIQADYQDAEKIAKYSFVIIPMWFVAVWATWMYSVPLSVSETYTWIRKLNRAKVQS